MQKKIIALAIAGLASTAAFAQSNVTIYGSIDMGYSYRYDTINPRNHAISGIDSGQTQGNRLGFKGVEDLGNGLKAVFLLESGFFADTGVDHTAGSMFSRQAYAGLTGGFGTLIGGRLYTPHFSFVSSIDPFSAGTVGQYRNAYGMDRNALLDPVRVDNAVAYVSPSFGGLTFTGAYSNNAAGQENAVDNSQNNTVYALLSRYTAGPVDIGLNLHRIAAASNNGAVSTLKSIDNATLGGTFDAKVVKIHALYSYNLMDNVAASSDQRIENWMIGASVPVGKVTIKTSYMFSDGNTAAGGNTQQLALGANYALSKRTDLYTAYAIIDNDSAKQANGTFIRRAAVVGDATNSGIGAQQGFQVGVRHTF